MLARQRPAYDWARRTTWNAGSVRVACAVLILLGLALLIAELKPARVSRLAADPVQGSCGTPDGVDPDRRGCGPGSPPQDPGQAGRQIAGCA